jgi:AcrR family transcriptional regulator
MTATPDRTREGGRMATRLSTPARHNRDDTRARIINATLQTVREQGIVGATARAIARTGDFNQALIFYHFGGVTELLVAAAVTEGEQRAARYAPKLEAVDSLRELVAVARELHEDESLNGGQNVLTQLLAGAASSPELRQGLVQSFKPWTKLVEDAVARVLAQTPFAGVVRAEDLAFAITSLFLGVELMHALDPDQSPASSLFGTFDALAGLVEALLTMQLELPAPKTAKKAATKKKR